MITLDGPPFIEPAEGANPASATPGTPWTPPESAPDDPLVARVDSVERAGWERPALVALLAITAVMYIWGLSASGWANSFYSAAAQAGSHSWKAWFFGSSDAASSITVDKPPASLWVMGLSVRIFGLSSWSILVPQALMGVGTVAVVYAAIRRRFSAGAALLAGAVLATTPVAALMFRFNNPDALLVLLMTLAAYTGLRGIEDGRRRWIVLTGVLIGFGFLTKQLQVLLVVPPLALAYLVAAPHRLRRRIGDLLIGGASMVAAAGWWILAVVLTPASMRPYVGGSQTNSILELTLGYNGFGRLTGNETGSVGTSMWGETGITRMFDGAMGGQIAWLLPAALIFIVAGLWITRGAARTDGTRAAIIVWGGWLVATALVFSLMEGIFHEYYTVALAPAIAAMIGIGAHLLWKRRNDIVSRALLGGTVVITALWSATLLDRATNWNSWLPTIVVIGGIVTGLALLFGDRLAPRVLLGAAAAATVASLAGPTAWALQTVSTPHDGSIVTAGPTVQGSGFGGGRPRAGAGNGLPGGGPPTGGRNRTGGAGANARGGLLNASDPSTEVVAALLDNSDQFTWVAATVGSNQASGYQLATDASVMPIGGFNGSDPSPTLERFQQYVANGEIHYFIAGGGFGQQNGGSSEAQDIASWVEQNFTATTVDGVTLYDLTS